MRVLCTCKTGVKCERHKCLFPSSKSSLEKLPFRVSFFLRKKPGWTRDLSPQRIFSSSSTTRTTTTTPCRQHHLLYSTTTTTVVVTQRRRRLGLRFRNKDEGARRPRTLLRVLLVPLFLSREEEGLRLYRGRVAVVMAFLLLLLARAHDERRITLTASTPTLA